MRIAAKECACVRARLHVHVCTHGCSCVHEGSSAILQMSIFQATPSTSLMFHKTWILITSFSIFSLSLVSFWNSRLAPVSCILSLLLHVIWYYSIFTCCTTSHVLGVCVWCWHCHKLLTTTIVVFLFLNSFVTVLLQLLVLVWYPILIFEIQQKGAYRCQGW